MDWDFNFDDILREHGVELDEADSAPSAAPAEMPEESQWLPPDAAPEEVLPESEYDSPQEADFTFYEPQKPASSVSRARPLHESEPLQRKNIQHPQKKPSAHAAPAPKNSAHVSAKADERSCSKDAKRSAKEERAAAKEAAIAAKEAERRADLRAREAERMSREQDKADREEAKLRAKAARKKRAEIRRRKFRTVLIILCAVLLLALAGGIYAGFKVNRSDKIFPNVYAGNINLGKMTSEEAAKALADAGWDVRTSTPLTVKTFGNVTQEIDPVKAGAVLLKEDVVKAAYAYGHDGSVLSSLMKYIEALIQTVDVNNKEKSLNTSYLTDCITEIETNLAGALGDEPYTVDTEAKTLVFSKGQGSMRLDVKDLYDAVLSALDNGTSELMFTSLSKEPVMPDIDAIHTTLAAEPENARYTDDGKFGVIKETVGCEFDVAAAKQAWEAAQPAEFITVPLSVTYPEVTGAALESQLYRDLLGAMTTKYSNSSENRCSNVRLATSKINGTIMYPGDSFSYNEVVGARTKEAGFLPAPAYAGVGEDGVKDEIGGGACQVSTTLYASTVFAFMETVERHNHIYPVNYIQLGTDATVTIPEDGGNIMDFKFRNNRNYPIKIVGYTEETINENNEPFKTITFEIWGTLEDNDYMPIEFDNSYSWIYDYDRFIDPAYPDRDGYEIKLTNERYMFEDGIGSGTRTITHREVHDADGNLILDEILNPLISTGHAMDTYYNHG